MLNGFIGFNRQVDDMVYGVEADWNRIDSDLTLTTNSNSGSTPTKIDLTYSARLRIGKAVDKALFYATGGLAWLKASHRTSDGEI